MIEIINSGWHTSVQDKGRWNSLHLGVPIGGAMDQESYQLANALLNNPAEEAVIEMIQVGAHFKFHQNTVICLTGAEMQPKLNGKKIKNYKAIVVKEGDLLECTVAEKGKCSYLGVAGGIQSEIVLGSKSQAKGITHQDRLYKKTIVPINTTKAFKNRFAHIKHSVKKTSIPKLIAFIGPEYHFLSDENKSALEKITFTISKSNNRMAIMVEERISEVTHQIWTVPVLPGTVQCTPEGSLILLMRDAQITGGYPRVLQLSEDAINLLAQLTTKDQFQFCISPINDTH